MTTITVTEMATKTITASASASSTLRAAPQGGILEGGNPSHYDPKNPIILFIIQASIILIFCRILHFPLSKLRQPRVIAEVIAGILLGPSVMGRVPGFNATIFASESMPALSVAANLGLIFFLFLVGLEVDLRFLASNWRIALSVGAAGMALPFGLGCAIAWGLYHQFREDSGLKPISFGIYMLFIGVAMAITAFPVLCRILTELKLLGTPVGVVVLSAGVANDVIGWILLALCVALVNSGAGLTALWIFFVAIGYTFFLVFAVRPTFLWILRKTGSLQNGPTQSVVALTILMVLASAFWTGNIGIHPIFGGFMIGLICPHEGGFAIKLTEKIEDLVTVFFLPLYFALSGLSTNLGLLDDGITWAYVVGVTAVAFVAKVAGGTLASWLNGLVFRESLTIGVLMSCKGLVELIVLNIGLQAKILSQRTFTIFVVMALITTFATTPLTTLLYPKWYQDKLDSWKKGKIDWDGNPVLPEDTSSDRARTSEEQSRLVAARVLVYLRLDGLPSIFNLMSLLSDKASAHQQQIRQHPDVLKQNPRKASLPQVSLHKLQRPLQVHGLRMIELTERYSSVMSVAELQDYTSRDPIIKSFRTFGSISDFAVVGSVSVVPEHSFAGSLLSKAVETSADLVLIPWTETGTMSEQPSLFMADQAYDLLKQESFTSFVSETLDHVGSSSIGVYLDRGVLRKKHKIYTPVVREQRPHLSRTATGISLQSSPDQIATGLLPSFDGHHIFIPFLGGLDDYLAVRLALQIARNTNVTATILKINMPDLDNPTLRLRDLESDNFFFDSMQRNLPDELKTRVVFKAAELPAAQTMYSIECLVEVQAATQMTQGDNAPELIFLTGRNRVRQDQEEVRTGKKPAQHETTLGPMSSSLLQLMAESRVDASLLVVQAGRGGGGPSGDLLKRE